MAGAPIQYPLDLTSIDAELFRRELVTERHEKSANTGGRHFPIDHKSTHLPPIKPPLGIKVSIIAWVEIILTINLCFSYIGIKVAEFSFNLNGYIRLLKNYECILLDKKRNILS